MAKLKKAKDKRFSSPFGNLTRDQLIGRCVLLGILIPSTRMGDYNVHQIYNELNEESLKTMVKFFNAKVTTLGGKQSSISERVAAVLDDESTSEADRYAFFAELCSDAYNLIVERRKAAEKIADLKAQKAANAALRREKEEEARKEMTLEDLQAEEARISQEIADLEAGLSQ